MDADSTARYWDELAERLERLIEAWEQGGEPPRLADFLPEHPAEFRFLTLVELIKVDLDYRRQRDQFRPLEEYCREFPELPPSKLPSDLIYEEIHIRRQAGEDASLDEYVTRFPDQAAEVKQLLGAGATLSLTATLNAKRITDVEAGQKIDDFELMMEIGAGAFAKVFLARQVSMQRMLAVKVSADRGNEPQTLAQLDHPHIVRVYDQRQLKDRGLRLLYMQYVEGGTLSDVIRRTVTLPLSQRSGRHVVQSIEEAASRFNSGRIPAASDERLLTASWSDIVCRIGAQLARALDYAHQRGVLHRDVKPANVLLASDGTAKLADFNVSASQFEAASAAAYFGGSLAYMSPEQLEASSPRHPRQPHELDARSDIYSLAIVLWELLHGERPFRDDVNFDGWAATLEDLAGQRRQGVSPRDSRLPGHAELQRLLLRCLAPDPDDRISSGKELAKQLELCRRPEARALLQTDGRRWSRLAANWPVLTVLLCTVLPNALAARFVYEYNLGWIKEIPAGQQRFATVQSLINCTAFPIGFMILVWLAWPLRRRAPAPDQADESDVTKPVRDRCLKVAHYAALTGVVLWLIASVAYPIAMEIAGQRLEPANRLKFLLSHSVCGLIAAAYPFFSLSFLCLRELYPALLAGSLPGREDRPQLQGVMKRASIYLLLGGGVPMLAMLLLTLDSDSGAKFAAITLGLAGLAGFGLSFWANRCIQRDASALIQTIDDL